MTSFFYSTKAADAASHPLPLPLARDRIRDILHSETLLPRILWPSSVMINRQQTLSGLEGVLSDSKIGVALLKLEDGVTCVEKIGGFTMTVTYTILDREAHGEGRYNALLLREERSIRALKPIASFAKFKEESPVKTHNLIRFFEAFAANGADASMALESIAEADVQIQKHKID